MVSTARIILLKADMELFRHAAHGGLSDINYNTPYYRRSHDVVLTNVAVRKCHNGKILHEHRISILSFQYSRVFFGNTSQIAVVPAHGTSPVLQ